MNREPEYGNDTACSNCGDEWAELSERGYCPECQEIFDEGKE